MIIPLYCAVHSQSVQSGRRGRELRASADGSHSTKLQQDSGALPGPLWGGQPGAAGQGGRQSYALSQMVRLKFKI